MFNRIYYGWWIVLSSFFILLYVGSVIFYSFTALFEPIANEFGWSYAQISLASSLRGLEMGILAPIVGFLVDRFGSRKLILCGVTTIGFGLIFLSRTQSLLMFYASFLIIAFGAGGCTNVTTMTAVTRWFSKKSGRALGLTLAGYGASGLFVPLIVFLIDAYGWRNAVIILGLGMWAIGIPLSFVIRDRPEQYGYNPDGEKDGPIREPSKNADLKKELRFAEAFRKRSFLYLNLSETMRVLIVSSVITHIMPYLSYMGVPRGTGGLVAAGIPLFSILGRLGLGWLGDSHDKRVVMILAYVAMGLGVFTLNYANNLWIIGLFILLYSPSAGGLAVMRGSILREYYGSAFYGKMIGILLGFSAIGGMIGPTLTGWLYDTFGNYNFIWIAFAGLIIVPILLIIYIRPEASVNA